MYMISRHLFVKVACCKIDVSKMMDRVVSSNHTSPFTEGCFEPFIDDFVKNTEEEK